MGEWEDSALKMRRVAAQLAAERDDVAPIVLDRAGLAGATFRLGERVRDVETGMEGEVVGSSFQTVIFPPA
jgi:hypothetical protein